MRDKANQDKLSSEGWNVIVVWECETLKEDKLLERIEPLLELQEKKVKF